jgi:tetratricopeptide (TPR) repeat protein
MVRLDDARKVLDEIAANDEAHDGPPRAFRLEAEGRYLAATGDPRAGVDLCRRAVDAVAETGALFYEGRARETLAELLAKAGEQTAAREEFERALALYSTKGFLPGVVRMDRKLAVP